MGDNKLPGCFKYGCIGCLTLFAMCIGVFFFFGAIQLTMDPEDPHQEQRELVQELPPSAQNPLLSDQPGDINILPLPEDPGERPRPGSILLDISMAEVTIEPGPAGEPIRVEADYDSNGFSLEEEFNTNDDGSWLYRVRFKSRKSLFSLFGNKKFDNNIRLIIPRGQPIELIGEIGIGESNTDLGGLWLQRVDLEYGMGDHFMEFREPLPFAMDSLRLDGSMGNLELRTLGNASPGKISVDHNMGDLLVDLKGTWRNDSDIDVELNMGQCRIWAPEDVRIDADVDVNLGEKRLAVHNDENLPADAPVLTINLDGNLGEMSIER